MTILLARRRFLFAAPAIVAVASLMPGHSVAKLLEPPLREFYGSSCNLVYGRIVGFSPLKYEGNRAFGIVKIPGKEYWYQPEIDGLLWPAVEMTSQEVARLEKDHLKWIESLAFPVLPRVWSSRS